MFQFRATSFRLSTAPLVFTHVVQTEISDLHSLANQIFSYLDDFHFEERQCFEGSNFHSGCLLKLFLVFEIVSVMLQNVYFDRLNVYRLCKLYMQVICFCICICLCFSLKLNKLHGRFPQTYIIPGRYPASVLHLNIVLFLGDKFLSLYQKIQWFLSQKSVSAR